MIEDFLLKDLNNAMRKKLKSTIQHYIKEQKSKEEFKALEHNLNLFEESLNETKKKRNFYFEKNRSREISEQEFERVMHLYEYEGYAFELEILLLKKELLHHNNFIKRLYCLLLLLDFPENVEELSIHHKILYKEDVYHTFFNYVLEEMKDSLDLEQKILQLYLLYNNGTNYMVDSKDKFYLSKEEKDNKTDELLVVREKLKKLKYCDSSKDIKTVSVQDLLQQNIELIYNQLFNNTDISKKRNL